MAVLIACTLGFGIYMERGGRASDLAEGYAATRDETAGAAWANTPQRKAACQFAQAGSIEILTRCDLPGWRVGWSRKGRATRTKRRGVNFTVGGSSDKRLAQWAHGIRAIGNEAAHDTDTELTKSDARDALDFTEALLMYVFALNARFTAFQQRRGQASGEPSA